MVSVLMVSVSLYNTGARPRPIARKMTTCLASESRGDIPEQAKYPAVVAVALAAMISPQSASPSSWKLSWHFL